MALITTILLTLVANEAEAMMATQPASLDKSIDLTGKKSVFLSRTLSHFR